ncbi:MAG: hypothetical protein R6V45_01070 [Oceanipulchritudo sp.]
MDWSAYILVGFLFAGLFFLGASAALYWAHKHGQLSNLEKGATSIFDEDEPMGEVTDSFPEKKRKADSGEDS